MSDPAPVVLPAAVETLLASLEARGFQAHVVGATVRALVRGEPVRDFEIATSADARALLALFERAVPLDSARRRLLLPTAAGPAELVPHGDADDIGAALARRDFTVNAIAVDASGRRLDPHGGEADLAASRLRCVGSADERLAEDPVRALRAARLFATTGLAPDRALEAALAARAAALSGVPAARLRPELHALLLGAHVDRGLALLRRSGLEAALAPGVAEDAAGVVAALPPDLTLRLTGWLRGARPVRTLRRLREPRVRVTKVERLLQLHPVDAPGPGEMGRLVRLARRAPDLVPGLVALRTAEIGARGEGSAARERLAAVRAALERALAGEDERGDALALDGRAVMEILGCGPGPEVGRALGQLSKDVAADPACNTPEALRERLLAWAAGRRSTT